jgi:hypothetical protein
MGVITPTWYVTFEVRKSGILPKERRSRETAMFESEAEAKTFARSKHEEGLTVFAGTINPHTPKQLIPSSRIHVWLDGEQVEGQPTPDREKTH